MGASNDEKSRIARPPGAAESSAGPSVAPRLRETSAIRRGPAGLRGIFGKRDIRVLIVPNISDHLGVTLKRSPFVLRSPGAAPEVVANDRR